MKGRGEVAYDRMMLTHWQKGADEFNAHRYWHAHHHWEQGWQHLPFPTRDLVQAAILTAGGIYLASLSRNDPAQRLFRAALRNLARVANVRKQTRPRLEISGVDAFLAVAVTEPVRIAESARTLRAEVVQPIP